MRDATIEILEDFVSANREQLTARSSKLDDIVFSPFHTARHGQLPRQESFDLLSACAASIEQPDTLPYFCKFQTIDVWLSFIRKLPVLFPNWGNHWIPHATLAILKWAEWQQDTTTGISRSERQFNLHYGLNFPRDLWACFDIAGLSKRMAYINNLSRWVGKGAHLIHSGDGKLTLQVPDEVRTAVAAYERRRPENNLWRDEGMATVPDGAIHEGLYPSLGHIGDYCPFARLAGSSERHRINYLPLFESLKPLEHILGPYSDVIESAVGSRVHDILYGLHALGTCVSYSIPNFDIENHELVIESGEPIETEHRTRFFLDLSRRGYIRFTQDYLLDNLSDIPLPAFLHGRPREMIMSFLAGASLTPEMRDQISVRDLQPFAFVYTSPGGSCYCDFVSTGDFIRGLLLKGKEWFPSQHGDRFAFWLQERIKKETDARIIPRRTLFKAPSGLSAQVDIAVEYKGTVFAIECKAYAKSRAFWRGDPEATARRGQKIKEAVDQAAKAANVLNEIRATEDPDLRSTSGVEWVVCTPSQEYICPVDRYGLLSPGVPRVCTPEELLSFLQRC